MNDPDADHAGVRFPPPFIFLGFLLLGLAFGQLAGLAPIPLPRVARLAVGLPLVAAGLALVIAAVRRFDAAGTRVEPWVPASEVVTGGVYRFTRNPMYLGGAVLSAGLAVALGSIPALLAVIPAVIVVDRFVIRREEAYLQRRFGEPYRDYRRRVRRWL